MLSRTPIEAPGPHRHGDKPTEIVAIDACDPSSMAVRAYVVRSVPSLVAGARCGLWASSDPSWNSP